MGKRDLTWAALSAAFLVVVFIASLVFLRRLRAGPSPAARPVDPRGLNEDEREKLRRRLERDAARMERERQAERAREALEMAKPSAYQEKLRRREDERLAQEQAHADALAAREREIAKWKSGISVVGEGADAPDPDPASIEDIVEYIKNKKTVELEALASAFGMTLEATVARIDYIERSNKLYGIKDDRGRYMSLSPAEIDNITKLITDSKSRKSLRQLHSELNRI